MRYAHIALMLASFFRPLCVDAQAPFPNQERFGNCGARCLFVIHSIVGDDELVFANFLKQNPSCTYEKISVTELSRVAANIGVKSDLVRFDPAEPLPPCDHLIAKVADKEHFVILSRKENGLWVYMDPPQLPMILPPAKRSELSGEAIAFNLRHETRWRLLLGVAGLFLAVSAAAAWYWRLWKSRRLQAGRTTLVIVVASCLSGCDSPPNPTQSAEPRTPDLRFDLEDVQLGELSMTDKLIPVPLRLFAAQSDKPTIETTCGCVDYTLSAYDDGEGFWPVELSVNATELGAKAVDVTAISESTGRRCKATVRYKVTGLISAKLMDQTFAKDGDSGFYMGELVITENPRGFTPVLSMALTQQQLDAEIAFIPEQVAPDRFRLHIQSPASAGYQQSFIQIQNEEGRRLQWNLRCDWGAAAPIECSVEQLVFSEKTGFQTSFLVHGDHKLPGVETISTDSDAMDWTVTKLQSALSRIELALREPAATSEGIVTIAFASGGRLTVPFRVEP